MIYVVIVTTLVLSIALMLWKGNETLNGSFEVGAVSFFAILFTTSLDGGLLLLPLLDFERFASLSAVEVYGFSNPLALEFGFWGVLSWACYFVTTCYFAIWEPTFGVFRQRWIKWINNLLIILTCAFTAWLLFATVSEYLPTHLLEHSTIVIQALIILVLIVAVLSSMRLNTIKWLSAVSLLLFMLLCVYVIIQNNMTVERFVEHSQLLNDYFIQIEHFVFPIDDYHQFYMFWWLAWSIMIGQFTAQFVKGLRVYQLMIALLIMPSIPIAIWFVCAFDFFSVPIMNKSELNGLIIVLAVLFVINSVDSMIRLYSVNLNLDTKRLGNVTYFIVHFCLLLAITVLFDYQVLSIELVGTIVFVFWLYALAFGIWRVVIKGRFEFMLKQEKTV